MDQAQQHSISLLRAPAAPATDFHSAPSSPVSDVFGSPQPTRPGEQQLGPPPQREDAGAATATSGSASFQFQPLLGLAERGEQPEHEMQCQQQQPQREEEDGGGDGASSSGETDDTVSEAALVARTMRRVGTRGREEVQVRRSTVCCAAFTWQA